VLLNAGVGGGPHPHGQDVSVHHIALRQRTGTSPDPSSASGSMSAGGLTIDTVTRQSTPHPFSSSLLRGTFNHQRTAA